MKKKIITITFIIILLILSIFGIKEYLNYKDKEKIKNAIIKVTTIDNLNIPYSKEIYLSDLIKDINGEIIEDFIINTQSLGEQLIEFKYINEEKIKVPYKIKINVIDNTSPIAWLNSIYKVKVGTSNLLDKIMCGDDLDDNPVKEIIGEYDLNKIGDYKLTYLAKDFSGNTTKIPFTLQVVDNIPNSSTSTIKFNKIYEKYKSDNTKIGIDVSRWQGNINYELVAKEGIDFVIIKLGGTDGIDGEYYLDSKFKDNIEGFSKLNIPIGLYFYSYANSKESAQNEALWIIDQIKDYKIDLPIFFDWENWASFNKFKISFTKLNSTLDSFTKTLKANGYNSMLYSSKNYLERIWNRENDNVWLAHYTSKTDYKGNYTFWQMTSSAIINGITENTVDVDIWYQ